MRGGFILIVALSFVLGFELRPVLATEIISTDGNWWNSLDDSSRVSTILGMTSAYDAGYTLAAADAAQYVRVHSSLKTANALEGPILDLTAPRFSKVIKTYMDEATDFYANNTDLDDRVDIGQVFSCLRDSAPARCLDNIAADARYLSSPRP